MLKQHPNQTPLPTGFDTLAERAMSGLAAHTGKVVKAHDAQTALQQAVAETIRDASLPPEYERILNQLITAEIPSSTDTITALYFKNGIDPDESASIHTILKDEPEIAYCSPEDMVELLAGKIFRAMENAGYAGTWHNALEILERNCSVQLLPSSESVRILKLTAAGTEIQRNVDAETARGFAIVSEILSQRDTPWLLRSLAEKLTRDACSEMWQAATPDS